MKRHFDDQVYERLAMPAEARAICGGLAVASWICFWLLAGLILFAYCG